jgi:hypothetical protein
MNTNMEALGKEVPVLFKVLVSLVTKNCVTRIILNTKGQNNKKELLGLENEEDSEGSDEEDKAEEDEDLMWDEEYTENNVSLLREVNELLGFKEIMEKLNREIPQIYQEMMGTIPKQKLTNL